MDKPITEVLLSDLNEDQKGHLAYRLENTKQCTYLQAVRTARGGYGNVNLVEVFEKQGVSRASAIGQTRAVLKFKYLNEFERLRGKKTPKQLEKELREAIQVIEHAKAMIPEISDIEERGSLMGTLLYVKTVVEPIHLGYTGQTTCN